MHINLIDLSQEEALELIRNLSPEDDTLDLSNNELGIWKSDQEAIELIQNIPSHIRRLNLANNFLFLFGEGFIPLIGAIPLNVMELNIARNGLDGLVIRVPINLLRALNPNLKKLTLGDQDLNELLERMGANLRRALPNLQELDVSGSGLNGQAFVTKMRNLTGRKLNLSRFDLHQIPPKKIRKGFEVLAQSFIELDISNTGLGRRYPQNLNKPYLSAIELGNILNVLKVSTLKLNGNKLAGLKRQLGISFTHISPSLKKLELCGNRFNILDIDDLVFILEKIPLSVKEVIVSGNNLFKGKTSAEKDIMLKKLQTIPRLDRFDFSGNGDAELVRCLIPLVSLARTGRTKGVRLPTEIAANILFFLKKPTLKETVIYDKLEQERVGLFDMNF